MCNESGKAGVVDKTNDQNDNGSQQNGLQDQQLEQSHHPDASPDEIDGRFTRTTDIPTKPKDEQRQHSDGDETSDVGHPVPDGGCFDTASVGTASIPMLTSSRTSSRKQLE